MQEPNERSNQLVQAFRIQYYSLLGRIEDVLETASDSTVIARIGDDLDTFASLIQQASRKYYVQNNWVMYMPIIEPSHLSA